MLPIERNETIADMIRNHKRIKPPADFTNRVMMRLSHQYHGVRLDLSSIINVIYKYALSPAFETSSDHKTRECSFYFFITGFFYLIIGIILMTGFKQISSSMIAVHWIRFQPHITIGIAVWLIALGIALLIERKNTIKVIRFGTLLYVFLLIINGALMNSFFSIPYAGIFTFGFIGTGVLMGVMLSRAVQNIDMRLK